MNFSSGLVGGIVGDAMKEGPSGLVGGIVGDRIKKDPRSLIGGLAGEMIDDPRRAIGGLAGAALGGNFGGGMQGLVDTKERIFRDGRIFSRPKGSGRVDGPDNRRFTPDSNPYDVEPVTPRYGEGTVDMFQVDPLDFLNLRLEQNKEVMGPKEQVFPRFADPNDGTLKNPMMAGLDPTDDLLLRSLRKGEIGPLTDPNIRKAIQDLEKRKYSGGRADSMEGVLMAEVPGYGPEIPRSMVSDVTEKVIPGYTDRRDALRRKIVSMLRGV